MGGTIICQKCDLRFACKLRKLKFEADVEGKGGSFWCQDCWNEEYCDEKLPKRYTTPYKEVEGGWTKAIDTSVELKPDSYDVDPEVKKREEEEKERARLEAIEEAKRAADFSSSSDGRIGTSSTMYTLTDGSTVDENGNVIMAAPSIEEEENFNTFDDQGNQLPRADGLYYCSVCVSKKAAKFCQECKLYYCVVCQMVSHRKNTPQEKHEFKLANEELSNGVENPQAKKQRLEAEAAAKAAAPKFDYSQFSSEKEPEPERKFNAIERMKKRVEREMAANIIKMEEDKKRKEEEKYEAAKQRALKAQAEKDDQNDNKEANEAKQKQKELEEQEALGDLDNFEAF